MSRTMAISSLRSAWVMKILLKLKGIRPQVSGSRFNLNPGTMKPALEQSQLAVGFEAWEFDRVVAAEAGVAEVAGAPLRRPGGGAHPDVGEVAEGVGGDVAVDLLDAVRRRDQLLARRCIDA